MKNLLLILCTTLIYSCSNNSKLQSVNIESLKPIHLRYSISKADNNDSVTTNDSIYLLTNDFYEVHFTSASSKSVYYATKDIVEPEVGKPFHLENETISNDKGATVSFIDAAELLKKMADGGYKMVSNTVKDKYTTIYMFEKNK
jgi:hypothetical protein